MAEGQLKKSNPDLVSAFTARRSRSSTFPKAASASTSAPGTNHYNDPKKENIHAAKKRKVEATARTSNNKYSQVDRTIETGVGYQKCSPKHETSSSNVSDSSNGTDTSKYISLIHESSDDSGEDSSDLESVSRTKVPVRKLSTFLPTRNNVVGETANEWTIYLTDNDLLTLLGQYDLWVRQGAVYVLGALLHPSSQIHRIYAPSTHSLPYIRHARDLAGPKDQPALITICSCTSGIRLLRKLSPLYSRIWNEKHTRPLGKPSSIYGHDRSFVALFTSGQDPYGRPLANVDILPDWQTYITKLLNDGIGRPKAVLVCGPKGSGKSTFTRILLNNLLNKSTGSSKPLNSAAVSDGVALLDLDPGQPEFSPPGEMSLLHLRSFDFGPPFTHPTVSPNDGSQLIRAHHFGSLSPYDDPKYYLACAGDLLNRYRRFLLLHPSCPLIINSCGWVFGGGSEVLAKLIRNDVITDVVYMSTEGPLEAVEMIRETARMANKTFVTVASQPSEWTTRNASELRVMQSLSYFHLGLVDKGGLRWNCSTMNELRPVCLQYDGPDKSLFGILVLGEEQDPDFLHQILNGSIVGLVAIEDDSCLSQPQVTEPSNGDDQVNEVEVGLSITLPDLDVLDLPELDKTHSTCSSQSHRTEDGKPYCDVSGRILNQADSLHLETPDSGVVLNTEGLPYFSAKDGVYLPLDPGKTQCLGQALIRGIDTQTKTLFFITPVPVSTLQSTHRKGIKMVLVRGNLDAPTWAYQEEYIKAAREARRLEIDKPADDRNKSPIEGAIRTKRRAREPQDFAPGTPWVAVAPGHDQRRKVWRVQKDIEARERDAEDDQSPRGYDDRRDL